MATLKRELREILERYEIDPRDKSQLWDCHGTLVLYHRAYEIIAAKEGIWFDQPVMIENDSANKIVAMLVVGRWKKEGVAVEQVAWSIGEAAPGNSKNAYPYAIAEKRAKDRVVSKLVGLAAYVYSEDEADSFSESKAEVSDASHVTAGAPTVSRFATSAEAKAEMQARAAPDLPATGAKETAAQRIMREIREAKFTATINTILAGNHSKMERWAADSEEGKAVVAGIRKLADDRITELSA